jgi:aminodeoxyfutalosine synthase
MSKILTLIKNNAIDIALKSIAEKVLYNERITNEAGLLLFEKSSLSFVDVLANYVR